MQPFIPPRITLNVSETHTMLFVPRFVQYQITNSQVSGVIVLNPPIISERIGLFMQPSRWTISSQIVLLLHHHIIGDQVAFSPIDHGNNRTILITM
ncbi:hypothetical protein BCIN_11g03510 [Botrytis cinerea B05.10]|uniref:Uncharacterized protein n=1 Tax=Botryotinia fuckeliana (strain B05.10) TaxID=332648 RepID=A0A384JWZ1_BOTFB|nr:hypothetical protein BCIN_11g03510 [Botrytis cinerea B05.10]ATZ55051.1 hypothetical protein BCIN_11g03510 [Botrytis cinerea B05.10]